MSAANHDVVIAGGGPVGLCLALALSRRGFRVALQQIKAPPSFTVDSPLDSRVYALAPDILSLLEDVGAWAVAASIRSCDYRRMEVYEDAAQICFDADDWGWPKLGAIVEHGVLVQALQACAGTAANLKLVHGSVIGVRREPQGVSLMTAHATLRAPLLVIAEGADSPLRDELGFLVDVHDYGQSAIGSHLSTALAHGGVARQRFVNGQPLALLPLPDGRVSLVWSVPRAAATWLCELDDSDFIAEVQAAFGSQLGRIGSAGPRVSAPLLRRHAQRYLQPGIALIGDAAHTIHPLAGQGLNLGLRDVSSLVTALSQARARDGDLGMVENLRRYERERRSENTLALDTVHGIGALFTPQTGPLPFLRQLGLTLSDRWFPARSTFARLAAGRLERPWG